MDEAIIIESEDKSGRTIYLTRERFDHILKHPEMGDKLEQIKDTLLHPDKITRASHDLDIHYYYKFDKKRKEYLFVSVKYLKWQRIHRNQSLHG